MKETELALISQMIVQRLKNIYTTEDCIEFSEKAEGQFKTMRSFVQKNLKSSIQHLKQDQTEFEKNLLSQKRIDAIYLGARTRQSGISFGDLFDYMFKETAKHPNALAVSIIEMTRLMPHFREWRPLRLFMLNELEQELLPQLSGIAQALVMGELGHFYADYARQDKSRWAEKAFQYFEKGLNLINPDETPVIWAAMKFGQGVVSRLRVVGERALNLEKAIEYLKEGLSVTSFSSNLRNRGMVLNELGVVYRNRINGSRKENLKTAVKYYNEALVCFNRQEYPQNWGMVQYNLGNIYRHYWEGGRSSNLEKAIEYYRNALEVRKKETMPVQWAYTNNGLAGAYLERIQGDATENIEWAIHYFQRAAEVFTLKNFPGFWAGIQNNLAVAFRKRIRGPHAENIEQALKYSKNALKVWTRDEFPWNWAIITGNLGNIYSSRMKGSKRDNKEKAIEYYKQATDVFTKKEYPQNWALLQTNLGNAYLERISGHPQDNLDRAVQHFNQALKVFTASEFPLEWSDAVFSLGHALGEVNSGSERYRKAVSLITASLDVKSPESFPSDARERARTLGNVHCRQGQFEKAFAAFEKAAVADKYAYQEAVLTDSVEREINEGASVYYQSAWCLAKMGRITDAFEWLERGKTRTLSEKTALDRAWFDDIREEDRIKYRRLTERLVELETEQRTGVRSLQDIAEDVKSTRYELDELIEKIRDYKPVFLRHGINFHSMYEFFPQEDAAVMEMDITDHGTLILLLFKKEGIPVVDAVFNDHFTLDRLVYITKLWLNRYRRFQRASRTAVAERLSWGKYIRRFVGRLSEELFAPALDIIYDQNVKRLMIVPHLSMHIFPLHLMSRRHNGRRRSVMEDMEVVFLPSLTLYRENIKQRKPYADKFTGITDPTGDLLWAAKETEKIKEFFTNGPIVLKGKHAAPSLVKKEIRKAGYVHLACHGFFDQNDVYNSGLALSPDEQVRPTQHSESSESATLRKLKIQTEKQMLTLSEIFTSLRTPETRLVVLSACESGLVDVDRTADEFVGLPAGFLYAGARSVVSSLWMVDDESTGILMQNFYRNLFRHDMSIPAALNAAQLSMKNDNKFKNPFFWAGFQVHGME